MRGQEVILLNFPISHFLKSLAHSAMSGGAKAAVTIQSAEKEVPVTKELAGGLTT